MTLIRDQRREHKAEKKVCLWEMIFQSLGDQQTQHRCTQGMSGVGEEEDRQTHTDGCVEEVAFFFFRIAQFL